MSRAGTIDMANPPPTLSTGEAAEVTGFARGTLWAAHREGGGIVVGGEMIRPIQVGRALRWPTRPILTALGMGSRDADNGIADQLGGSSDLTRHQVERPPDAA